MILRYRCLTSHPVQHAVLVLPLPPKCRTTVLGRTQLRQVAAWWPAQNVPAGINMAGARLPLVRCDATGGAPAAPLLPGRLLQCQLLQRRHTCFQ